MSEDSKLKRCRLARKLSLQAVADAVECDPTTLSRIEAGTRRPSIPVARRLFDFYDGEISLCEIHDHGFDPKAHVIEPA